MRPAFPVSQWPCGRGSPLTVAGAATDSREIRIPCSLFRPRSDPGNQHGENVSWKACASLRARARKSDIMHERRYRDGERDLAQVTDLGRTHASFPLAACAGRARLRDMAPELDALARLSVTRCSPCCCSGCCGASSAAIRRGSRASSPRAAASHLLKSLHREPDHQPGHNPAGGWMVLLLLVLLLGETLSGLYVANDIADVGPFTALAPARVANAIAACTDPLDGPARGDRAAPPGDSAYCRQGAEPRATDGHRHQALPDERPPDGIAVRSSLPSLATRGSGAERTCCDASS